MKIQSLKNKLSEVRFRKKLTQQHAGERIYFPKEPDSKEIIDLLKERIENTRKTFKLLKKRGLKFFPYLELGAERCQRAMILENDFDACGFATDLSLESLRFAQRILKPFAFQKMPYRICCDHYHLPFRNNSFPFVFCYQTLHHFPDPLPILKEIKRVLVQGGYFYFNEEPIKQLFNLGLWRRAYRLNPFERFLRKIKILPFVSKVGKTEVEQGILEESFWLNTWQRSLDVFEKCTVTLQSLLGPSCRIEKRERGWDKPKIFVKFLLALVGGGIEALCQVKKNSPSLAMNNILDALGCPNCWITNHQGIKDRPKLKNPSKGMFICDNCGATYKTKDNILILLPKKEEKALYRQT